MAAIFQLSVLHLSGFRRLLLLLGLAALPIALALIVSLSLSEDETSNQGFVDALLDGLLISGIMPIISLVLATTLFGNEIEDRTLNYVVLRPVTRYRIVLAKVLAAIAIGAPLVIASGVIATWLGSGVAGAEIVRLDSGLRAIAAVVFALLLGCIAYSALFTWAGLMSTRALPYSLVYVVLWEGVLSSFFDGIRYLSIRGYTLGIVHGIDDVTFSDLSNRAIELPAALLGVVAVTLGFLYLTSRRLDEMDVP